MAAAAGAFLAGPASRVGKPYLVMFGAILASVLAVAITPLLGAVFLALAAGAVLRGATNGISQPLVISTVLRAAGTVVEERTISFDEVLAADELFATGNYSKVMPITRIEDRALQPGPLTDKARALYFHFAEKEGARRR